MLIGTGPENAKIILLTDYPTKESLANDKVCFGSEQLYYSRIFKQTGYELNKTFRTSFFRSELPLEVRKLLTKNKLRYPIAKDNPFAFMNQEIEQAAQMFMDEIKVLDDARWIISAGEIPLNILCNEKKIGKFQGSILPISDKILVNNPHASKLNVIPLTPYRSIIAQPMMEPIQPIFVGKAIKYLTEQYVPFSKKYNIWVCDNATDFRNFINRHKRAKFWTSDFETLHNYPTCISFCGDGAEAITIPLVGSKLPIEMKVELWKAIQDFFKWLRYNNIPLVNQNFNYDWHIGDKSGFEYGECYGGDTMIAAHVLYPEFARDLGFLTAIYTDIPYFKDEGKEFDPRIHDFSRLYLYCAQDSLATHVIKTEQEKDLEDLGLTEFYEKKEAPLLLLYHSIEKNGIRVDDIEKWKLVNKYEAMLDENSEYVKSFAETELNLRSPKQTANFVYNYLSCPERFNVTFDPETGERSKTLATGADDLEEIAIRESNPTVATILYKIIGIRKIEKILSFLKTPTHPDGKMRCGTKLTGTKSGRTSGAQTLDFELVWSKKKKCYEKIPMGYSFQTIPKHSETLPDGTIIGGDLRKIFVTDNGFVFIEGDKSQAEARVVCVLANDLKLLPLFDDKKIGIHRTTASWIYNVEASSISKKDDNRYDIGKRARHAGNYGMTPPRLAIMAHIKMNMAEFILNKFHAAQPNIQDIFHRDCINIITNTHPAVMITPFGRRREFFGIRRGQGNENLYKEAFSYYPQATVSDDLKFGAKRIWDKGGSGDNSWLYFLNEAHDSLLATVKVEDKNRYVDLWKDEMEMPIDFNQGTFKRDIQLVIPTELQIGYECWAGMEDLR